MCGCSYRSGQTIVPVDEAGRGDQPDGLFGERDVGRHRLWDAWIALVDTTASGSTSQRHSARFQHHHHERHGQQRQQQHFSLPRRRSRRWQLVEHRHVFNRSCRCRRRGWRGVCGVGGRTVQDVSRVRDDSGVERSKDGQRMRRRDAGIRRPT